jgi:hypothetical protein
MKLSRLVGIIASVSLATLFVAGLAVIPAAAGGLFAHGEYISEYKYQSISSEKEKTRVYITDDREYKRVIRVDYNSVEGGTVELYYQVPYSGGYEFKCKGDIEPGDATPAPPCGSTYQCYYYINWHGECKKEDFDGNELGVWQIDGQDPVRVYDYHNQPYDQMYWYPPYGSGMPYISAYAIVETTP